MPPLISITERTFHRCFLPSFSSFGGGVSEEKIKMWKVNVRQTPSDGKSSHSCNGYYEFLFSHWYSGKGFGATIPLLIWADLKLLVFFLFFNIIFFLLKFVHLLVKKNIEYLYLILASLALVENDVIYSY
jgi:hypothetical protein